MKKENSVTRDCSRNCGSYLFPMQMEELNWRSRSSQAKSLGTLASIAGAFVMTFYNGPLTIRTLSGTASLHQLLSQQSNWILGAFFLAAEALSISAIYITQILILRNFQALLILMFYQFFLNTILSTVFSLIMVTDPSAWKLRLDVGLFAVIYSAVIGCVFRVGMATWCLSKTGPLFVAMFKPLGIIFSVVMGVIFLADPLCLGSLVGGVIIVAGFYSVIWGKFKEQKTIEQFEKVPLLKNKD
ncbi:WAT1-related protein [Melia azedarach]|uniref:WAT1-related protein n=1 Tax=Melia azedarach TaxID=155640 RepID=A0ACC1XJK0_MELAZ|nr:WAT1-related protein [Melia azedarach]